ncbi:hypothetical protein PHYPSEUDO_001823 [Phytophthora pseudosyringae]|uniref:Uncharacterized protein n=1 Tax=Phytophthora pseudosyringae TaxID=221518 RepID=A0A8T1VZ10_9STRA|nr:hypothetical protein PHYPSEUDO_001823 [Phytophthora pseudosyringae]
MPKELAIAALSPAKISVTDSVAAKARASTIDDSSRTKWIFGLRTLQTHAALPVTPPCEAAATDKQALLTHAPRTLNCVAAVRAGPIRRALFVQARVGILA